MPGSTSSRPSKNDVNSALLRRCSGVLDFLYCSTIDARLSESASAPRPSVVRCDERKYEPDGSSDRYFWMVSATGSSSPRKYRTPTMIRPIGRVLSREPGGGGGL